MLWFGAPYALGAPDTADGAPDTGAQASTASSDAAPVVAAALDTLARYHDRLAAGRGFPGTWDVAGGWPMRRGAIAISGQLRYSAAEGLFWPDDRNTQIAFVTTAAWSLPFVSWLELALAYTVLHNDNSRVDPRILQVFGDPELTLRFPFRLRDDLALAGSASLRLPSGGANDLFIALDSPALDLTIAGSLRALEALNLHLALGVVVDRTATWLERGGIGAIPELHGLRRFVARASNTSRAQLGLAAEYLLPLGADMLLGPFVSFHGVAGFGVARFADNPAWSGIGLRWRVHGFELQLGADVGLSGAPRLDNPLPGITPWSLGLLAAYQIDVLGEPETIVKVVTQEVVKEVVRQVEVVKEVPTEVVRTVEQKTWVLTGRVLDARDKSPLGRAAIEIVGSGASPISVHADSGAFQTFALPGDKPVLLNVTALGFVTRRIPVTMTGERVELTIELQPEAEASGWVKGSALNMDGKPVKASIFIPELNLTIRTDPKTGRFQQEVRAGVYELIITASGYRMQKKDVEIRPGEVLILNVDLRKSR